MLVTSLIAAPAVASANELEDSSVGIGAKLNVGGIGLALGSLTSEGGVLLPIQLGDSWRLEPSLQFSYFSFEDSTTTDNSVLTDAFGGKVAVAAHYLIDSGPTTRFYFGPDFGAGVNWWSSDGPAGSASDDVGLSLQGGAVFGAEVRPLDRFSIALELGVAANWNERTTSGTSDFTWSSLGVSSTSALVFRFL